MRHAQNLFSSGRTDEAADCCISGLADDPGNPALMTLLGRCDERRGDFAGAIERLQAAAAADERHIASRFHLARLLAGADRLDEARRLFGQCLALNPNHAPARTMLARLDLRNGRFDSARSGLRSALVADPEHVPALTSLGAMLLDDGEVDAAYRYASEAVGLRPDRAEVQMLMARVFEVQGHGSFAERCLVNAIEAEPANPAPRVALARLLRQQGRESEALEALRAAGELDTEGPGRVLTRARGLMRAGRLADARADFEHLVRDGSPEPEIILELFELYLALNDTAAAERLLTRAENVVSGDWQGLVRARLAEFRGQTEAAWEDLAGLPARSGTLGLLAGLATARLALQAGDTETARAALDALEPDARRTFESAWLRAGLEMAEGRDQSAIDVLRTALDSDALADRERARIHSRLADLLDRQGHHAEAGQHVRQGRWRAPFPGRASASVPEPGHWRGLGWPEDRSEGEGLILVSGWPGSGRELVLAALAHVDGLNRLPAGEWAERQASLGLPADPAAVATLDEAQAHVARRRYRRRLPDNTPTLEPGFVHPADLALFGRVFPGASVIRLQADEKDLLLHWQLAGYRDTASMRRLWRAEQEQLDELAECLPVSWITVERGGLISAPVGAVGKLLESLGLASNLAVAPAVDEARQQCGYRPDGHWQRYRSLIDDLGDG